VSAHGNVSPVCSPGELLPGRATAYVERSKLERYVLDPTSDVGRHKARVFRAVLDVEQRDWAMLRTALCAGLQRSPVTEIRTTRYGHRYTVPMEIRGNNGKVGVVTTAWELDAIGRPRLLTAYIRAA